MILTYVKYGAEDWAIFVDEVVRSPEKRKELKKAANEVVNEYFEEDLEADDAPEIVVVENSATKMYMVIAELDDADGRPGDYYYPKQYNPRSNTKSR